GKYSIHFIEFRLFIGWRRNEVIFSPFLVTFSLQPKKNRRQSTRSE
ncbi:hypothetical protein PRIPAC_72662, partial [Pristionchus pacificus]